MAKYLDLRVDKVFKAVFAQRAHKSSLIDLLNDLLPELNIRDLTYIRGEMQGYCFDSKSSRFDLCCELDDGTEVTIEMQVGTQKFFKDRAELVCPPFEVVLLKGASLVEHLLGKTTG